MTPKNSGQTRRDIQTPGRSERRLLGRVTPAEAAARTGLAGDAAEMVQIAERVGALEGTRVLLSRFTGPVHHQTLHLPVTVEDPSIPPVV